jgi:hypothetical protein
MGAALRFAPTSTTSISPTAAWHQLGLRAQWYCANGAIGSSGCGALEMMTSGNIERIYINRLWSCSEQFAQSES